MIEAESVKALNKQFDSKATGQTGNGHAVVADPESNEINQAYLSYSGIDNTVVKWGRQRLILDNARFVGNVGWRQNEQTFDAFTIVNKSLPDTTITAGYVTNVLQQAVHLQVTTRCNPPSLTRPTRAGVSPA
jgi:hypothetical protein